MDILKKQLELRDADIAYAVVTVVENKGVSASTPGKKMIVTETEIFGTVGGSGRELMAIEKAREALKTGQPQLAVVRDESDGMNCGVTASVFIEPTLPQPRLVVCGAGHVGGVLLQVAKIVGMPTTLIDNRDVALIQDKIALADEFIHCENFTDGVANADFPAGSFYFCCAWSHEQDMYALKGCIEKDFAYIGMLGSPMKKKNVFAKLIEQGVSAERLEKVSCPSGLDVSGPAPGEIAVSLMAEILMVKNNLSGRRCCEFMK